MCFKNAAKVAIIHDIANFFFIFLHGDKENMYLCSGIRNKKRENESDYMS